MAQGQGAHHHRRRGRDEVHKTAGRLEGRHHQGSADPGEPPQRSHNGHGQRGKSRGRGDQEAQRQIEEEDQQHEGNAPRPAEGGFPPVEYRVCHGTVVHQNGDAPADADDEGHPQHIRAARHEGLRDLVLPPPVHKADDDTAHKKKGRELREPPAKAGQPQSHLIEGDDAVGHQQKGQGEEEQNRLPPGRQGQDLLGVHMETAAAHPHHGAGGVPPHPLGVGHHIPDGKSLEEDPLEKPQPDALPQGDPRKARGDAGGKGVYRGGHDPRSGPQQDHADAHHRVIPRRQEDGDQKRVEGHGLLPHTVGGAPQAKEQHQDGDEPLLPAVQPGNDIADPGIDGPALHHDAQEAPHHQDKDADVHRVVEAGEGRLGDGPQPLGAGLHALIGAGNRDAVQALIASRRNQPGGGGHQDNQQEKDGVCRWHAEALHRETSFFRRVPRRGCP